jgi:ABC-2 type transport system permease protein
MSGEDEPTEDWRTNLLKARLDTAVTRAETALENLGARSGNPLSGPLEAIEGFLLLLLFAYAISWIMAYVGLNVSSVEVVNNASFMVIFPATFISNAFVRPDLLPGPLQAIAEWNPVSSVGQAVREAFGNTGNIPEPEVWSLDNPVAYTLIWVGIILAIFVPLSIRQYKKAATR